METGLNAFKEALHLKHVEAGEYSPLALMQDVANILSQREPDRSLSVGLEGEARMIAAEAIARA